MANLKKHLLKETLILLYRLEKKNNIILQSVVNRRICKGSYGKELIKLVMYNPLECVTFNWLSWEFRWCYKLQYLYSVALASLMSHFPNPYVIQYNVNHFRTELNVVWNFTAFRDVPSILRTEENKKPHLCPEDQEDAVYWFSSIRTNHYSNHALIITRRVLFCTSILYHTSTYIATN